MSILNEISFENGIITFDDLKNISDKIPLEQQVDELKEDLLQVEFPENILLDVGWYPSFDINGEFRISVIKDFDWVNPIVGLHAATLGELKVAIEDALTFVKTRNSGPAT